MRNHLLRYGMLLCTLLFLFNSCKKEPSVKSNEAVEKPIKTAIDYIKSLGFRESEIKDIGENYLVNEDILFSKKQVEELLKKNNNKLRVDQYGSQNYLGLLSNVIIKIDPSMNSYVNEINSAITQWNNVPNCRVKFIIHNGQGVPYAPPNVTITNGSLGTNTCGAAYYPMNGAPGNQIWINLAVTTSMSFDQRQRTVTHELGHTIGLAHTNWFAVGDAGSGTTGNGAKYNTTHILGTPTGYDYVSLMNSGECSYGATQLSDYDKIAVQFIYPENPPVAGMSPVFRYNNVGNGDHFYTSNYYELSQGGNNSYLFEGVGFFAPTSQISGTSPVYRYYNSGNGDHYYTRTLGSYSGYTYERVAFYAYASATNGAVPVYGYYNTQTGDHFYTKNQNEFINGTGTYAYEGVQFYAY
ncbi:M57 family metalloprotease [Mucilaginibacter roseus]|uniref:M57 family metalloprotease n=1 Tax=Mucilaginibacter roseus TaxID=1528868 RepID=A0ABS8U4I2_9SPHI|nr:M57 family metalloprotease [Mucilaginibacter roseus]MCD8741207.1 M57 family metalloprotease [Mucilaginibacter roseus]